MADRTNRLQYLKVSGHLDSVRAQRLTAFSLQPKHLSSAYNPGHVRICRPCIGAKAGGIHWALRYAVSLFSIMM